MRKFYGTLTVLTIFLLSATVTESYAQSTFDGVYNILSTKCQGSGCHGGGGSVSSGLDFSQPKGTVYNLIINKVPLNQAAADKGNKIIAPGYPHRSFLLRKVANCIEPELALTQPDEGHPMPDGRPSLSNSEIELIRQWIIYAAPQTGTIVDTSLINAVYNGTGMPKMAVPAPPRDCEGFQVHLGPIFLEPQQEDEWFKRFDLNLPDSVEVNRLELFMNDESHHYILRKFQHGAATDTSKWPLAIGLLNPVTAFDADKDYVMAWQDNGDIPLPNGTAYKWEANTVLDLNYHVKNYNAVPMAVDAYLNVHTQPKGTALKEMKSSLINELIFGITPNDTITKTYNTGLTAQASIWTITSHTHKYAIDYDVYLKKPGGGSQKGDQIFEGFKSNGDPTPGSGFNQGFYNWEHPPTRWMEPFLYMGDTMSNGQIPSGLIHEAKYYNYGTNTVNFGFTTADEMMIIYVQYVDGRYTIPSTGWSDPNCLPVAYINPCLLDTIQDTTALAIGDTIKVDGIETVLGSTDTVDVSSGDTVTIIVDGDTTTFIVTGSGGPFGINVGDEISTNSAGTVFLNGTAIGTVLTDGPNGIEDVAAGVKDFVVFPNPFQGQTQVQYILPHSSTVTVEIFDLMGKRITNLVNNEFQPAGAHAYLFDAGTTPSGVYLVKLTVNGKPVVRKISVMN